MPLSDPEQQNISILPNTKIALVHDWLLGMGGADRVLKALHKIFPQAPIYTLFFNPCFTRDFLPEADIRATHLQKNFRPGKKPSRMLPYLPSAIESLDFSEYDLVISSSTAYSKGLILKPKTMHISYCYSPTRQVWDRFAEGIQERSALMKIFTALSQHILRLWDSKAATRVDHFIAISKNVQKRIKKYYHRDSRMVYPPVDIASRAAPEHKVFYLIVSRLYKHKNVDIAVKAFNKLGWPLVIIGDGPEYRKLKSLAEPNVTLMGYQDDKVVAEHYRNCIAFIMPQEEDFGLTPIEAMSYGKPVVALKAGGAVEYIDEGINGIFFEDPTEASLANGVRILKESLDKFNPEIIRKTALPFGPERFEKEIRQFVIEKLHESREE
ncbi:MAG: glycosyltransferase [Parcubacteria group bacterium]